MYVSAGLSRDVYVYVGLCMATLTVYNVKPLLLKNAIVRVSSDPIRWFYISPMGHVYLVFLFPTKI